MKLYPIVDFIPTSDLRKWGLVKGNLSFSEISKIALKLRACDSGEFRNPKKGEYFLSGAIVEAYRANKDLLTPYHIAKIVSVETETIVKTRIIS
jgi:hypothetical protein